MLVLGAAPLLAACPAPLQDWPNHIARAHVLAALLRGDAFWQRYYTAGSFLLPGAALDLALQGLMRLGLSAPAAAALFLGGTYAAFAGGVLALSAALRAHRAPAGLPVKAGLAVLLFYGAALFWGLVNYVLGIGVLLALVAACVGLRHRPLPRAAVAAGGTVLLVCVHLVPAAVFPLVLAGFDLARAIGGGGPPLRRAAGSLSWLAALLALLAALAVLPAGGAGMHYPGAGLGGHALWKARVFATVLLGGGRAQDAASLLALGACAAALASAARVRLQGGAALVACGLVLLVLLAPERLGSGSLLDVRLAILPLAFTAAALRIGWRAPARRRRALIGVAAAALLLRTAILAAQWHAAGLVFAQFRAAASGLPQGGVMMMAYGTPLARLSWRRVWSPPITSLATGVALRGVFYPALFANPAQQPIRLRPPYRDLAQPWNLTDADHRRRSGGGLRPLCDGRFAGVFLTVLYPADVAAWAGAAVLHAQPDFVLLDACRLPQA